MNTTVLKRDDFHVGKVMGQITQKPVSVVLAFDKKFANLSNKALFENADVATLWGCYLNKVDSKMDTIMLKIEWRKMDLCLEFQFNGRNPLDRAAVRVMAEDGIVALANLQEDSIVKIADSNGVSISGASGVGVSVDIGKNQVLDWLKMEKEGKSVKDYKEVDSKVFHEEFNFIIDKRRSEEGRTFSKDALDTYLQAIKAWIRDTVKSGIPNLVGKHWATKKLTIKVIVDGQYKEEVVDGGKLQNGEDKKRL